MYNLAQKSNKEELKGLEMAKKRNHKIMIKEKAIKKVPRIRYKNIPESEYNTIQELATNVLQISKDENDSNKGAITYSIINHLFTIFLCQMYSFYYESSALRR